MSMWMKMLYGGVLSEAEILENTLSVDEDIEDDKDSLPFVTLKEAN